MSRRSRGNLEWEVRASTLARNTINPIRSIVENLQVEPNPEKEFIALSIGDPTTFGNLNPPDHVLQAVRDSIESHTSRGYGPAKGHLEARQAVAEYSAHQGDITPEDVILCSGCSHAIELVITALADSGQNILVPRPGFMIYKTLAEGLGIVIKYYNLLPEEQWKVDLEDLETQIDDDTVAIVVINPSNPCGSVYDKQHLYEILDVASRNHVPIIADEIYEHFVFSGNTFTAISSISKDVPIVTCGGLTKRFLVPGWRMGWVIIHDRNNILGKEIRQGIANLAARIMGPSTLLQRALPTILKNTPQTFFDEVVLFIESQAKLAFEELRHAPGLRPIMPQGAMYMMIGIKMSLFPKFKNELQFVEYLVSQQSIFCLPGKCFEYPNYMRIVLTVPEDKLREACQRIVIFCKEHCDTGEKVKEMDMLSVSNDAEVICDPCLTRVAQQTSRRPSDGVWSSPPVDISNTKVPLTRCRPKKKEVIPLEDQLSDTTTETQQKNFTVDFTRRVAACQASPKTLPPSMNAVGVKPGGTEPSDLQKNGPSAIASSAVQQGAP